VQASLNKIAKMWGDTNFVTKPYREMKHVYILGGLDDVFTLLEDNQVLLQTMMGSRFIAGVQVRLGEECGGGHRDGRAVSK
jgi:dynein heavy chain